MGLYRVSSLLSLALSAVMLYSLFRIRRTAVEGLDQPDRVRDRNERTRESIWGFERRIPIQI